MTETKGESTRVSVRTYLPEYQREEWDDHAEELDMSRSEYVKAMVQAGRRGFLDDETNGGAKQATDSATTPDQEETGASGGGLEEQVLNALAENAYLDWDELVAAVTDDVERRLEATLQELQADDAVRYSGPNGGYTLDEQ